MVFSMRRYKYLLFSILLRIFVVFLTNNITQYIDIVYLLPTNLLHLSINLSILIFDILFITDSILYYLKMKDTVLLRISKKQYKFLLIKKAILSTIEIIILQFLITFICFHNVNINVIITYTVILYLLYIICFTLLPAWIDNHKLMIVFIIMLVIKAIF